MFCSGEVGGYPYIWMPGSSVLHLCDIRKPMRQVTHNNVLMHLPNPSCHQARYARGRFQAVRQAKHEGRRVCKVCLRDYQNQAAWLAGQLHGITMVVRGW